MHTGNLVEAKIDKQVRSYTVHYCNRYGIHWTVWIQNKLTSAMKVKGLAKLEKWTENGSGGFSEVTCGVCHIQYINPL